MENKFYLKLDGRNTGYTHFKYLVNARTCYLDKFTNKYQRTQLFYEFKSFCTDTFGHSKDLVDWLADIDFDFSTDSWFVKENAYAHNGHWSYLQDENREAIYLRTEEDLSTFLLRFK